MLARIFLLAVALFSYLMLPRLIESRLAADLKEQYGLKEEPTVEVFSSFPPELLIGRIDRIDVQVDQFVQEGVPLRGLYVNLENVDISVRSLLQGNLQHEIWSASLVAEVPEDSINAYLWKNNPLGLGGREIDVRSQDVVYRSADVLFGLPVSVGLWVSGPGQIEVFPQEATMGEFVLPPSLMRPLTPEERTLDLGELPLGVELRSVEPFSEEALVVRADK